MPKLDKEFLLVLPRPPEPDGAESDRKVYALLARLSRSARLFCLAESAPVSTQILKAGLAARGVNFIQSFAPDSGALHDQIRAAVRGRRFEAILLVGAATAGRWMRPLRMLIPDQVLIAYFPDTDALIRPLDRFSASVRQGQRARWRHLLSLADGLWVDSAEDGERLRRAFFPLEVRIDALSALRPERTVWLRAALRRRAAACRSSGGSVAIVSVGLSSSEAEAHRAAAARCPGRAPSRHQVPRRPSGTVGALNRLFRGLRADVLWVLLHPFEPSENLYRTLLEGLRLLPYAGAAVPADFGSLRRPAAGPLALRGGLFAAAWALKRKGDWQEIDQPRHACSLMLRREAMEEAGFLDERFHDPDYAWIDYCLRLQQAGRPVFLARNALSFCRKPKRSAGVPALAPLLRIGPVHAPSLDLKERCAPAADSDDRELLIEKWCKGSLKFMETLLTSLEPEGYRRDLGVAAAEKGR